MPEYKFEIKGREDLLIPTGTSERGMLCWVPHYEDKRIGDIENLLTGAGGRITHCEIFFTPTAGKVDVLRMDAELTRPEQLELFNSKLSLYGYESSNRQLSSEEIQQRNEAMERARLALERAVACCR